MSPVVLIFIRWILAQTYVAPCIPLQNQRIRIVPLNHLTVTPIPIQVWDHRVECVLNKNGRKRVVSIGTESQTIRQYVIKSYPKYKRQISI